MLPGKISRALSRQRLVFACCASRISFDNVERMEFPEVCNARKCTAAVFTRVLQACLANPKHRTHCCWDGKGQHKEAGGSDGCGGVQSRSGRRSTLIGILHKIYKLSNTRVHNCGITITRIDRRRSSSSLGCCQLRLIYWVPHQFEASALCIPFPASASWNITFYTSHPHLSDNQFLFTPVESALFQLTLLLFQSQKCHPITIT